MGLLRTHPQEPVRVAVEHTCGASRLLTGVLNQTSDAAVSPEGERGVAFQDKREARGVVDK